MALPTLFWTGEPLRTDGGAGDRDHYIEYVEHDHNHFGDAHHHGPYRRRREADGGRWGGRPVRGLVLLQRGKEALASLLSSDPKDKFRETARILSPAMMQGWDIGETIRAMTCPQCLLEGFVLSSLFVSRAPLN